MKYNLTIEKVSKYRLDDIKLREQLKFIKGVASRKSYGFEARISRIPQPTEEEMQGERSYRYTAIIRVEAIKARNAEHAQEKFDFQLLPKIRAACEKQRWYIRGETGLAEVAIDQGIIPVERKPFELPILNETSKNSFFGGIYERDPHIRIIHASAARAVQTGFRVRSHILLYGEPAACKSTLFREGFKKFYEQDGQNHIDIVSGPTITKAGLEKYILERAKENSLSEFLLLEEIEKMNPDFLLSLLEVMSEGYISRLNARIGKITAVARPVLWATCNDEQVLKNFRRGALWSRFSHRLCCNRPSKTLMRKILKREIDLHGGEEAWITPAIEFGYKVLQTNDPRTLIGLLDGGPGLISGDYQKDYKEAIKEERSKHVYFEQEQAEAK